MEMENKIRVLCIIDSKTRENFPRENNVIWKFFSIDNLANASRAIHLLKYFDFIYLSESIKLPQSYQYSEFKKIKGFIKPYKVLIGENVELFKNNNDTQLKASFKKLLPIHLNCRSDKECIEHIICFFSKKYYGGKITVNEFKVNENRRMNCTYHGNAYIHANFLEKMTEQQLGFFKYSLFFEKGKIIEFYPKFLKDETINLSYNITVIDKNNGKVLTNIMKTAETFVNGITLSFRTDAYVSISVMFKGTGSLRLGNIYYRTARSKYGCFMIGAKCLKNSSGGEIYTYFNPGNWEPPLNIYFSGYRKAGGFEGKRMMDNLKNPYLLVADQRLEGGAFYMDKYGLENSVREEIKNAKNILDFKDEQLIFSGLSMGSYGALYYAADFSPKAIILGKPLVSLEGIRKNLLETRPDEFHTIADLADYLDFPSLIEIDNQFSNKVNSSDWRNTQLYYSFMENDDYDSIAHNYLYDTFIKKVYNLGYKGFIGRHNDQSSAVTTWFLDRFSMVKSHFQNQEEDKIEL